MRIVKQTFEPSRHGRRVEESVHGGRSSSEEERRKVSFPRAHVQLSWPGRPTRCLHANEHKLAVCGVVWSLRS